MSKDRAKQPVDPNQPFDTSTDNRFFQYYTEQSQSPAAIGRFERLADLTLKQMQRQGRSGPFDVLDVGGGAGTLGRIYAAAEHRVTCVDISEDLLSLGRQRAAQDGLAIEFINCSATALPLADRSVDICLVPELLEHVVDWQAVLDQASRVLRPGGLLFLSTTNTLCPLQDEFELPLYSWYPPALKRYCVKLARTTRPQLANYGKYPAVNWFTFKSLCAALRERRFDSFMDRLDMMEVRTAGTSKARIATAVSKLPLGRFITQMATPNSLVLAVKSAEA